jgi:DNA-directed RNA polymerase specialized sigma24 family protein
MLKACIAQTPMQRTSQTHATKMNGAEPVPFPPTLWTIVLDAKHADSERAEAALGELCVHYQEAILAYFRLKCRHAQDAEDLTGEFIAHLLERRRLGGFERGSCTRFRAYLSVALKNFFLDWLEKRNAEKRGAGRQDESLEVLREAGIESATQDRDLNRAVDLGVARTVHRHVMETLAKKASSPERFEALRVFVPYEQDNSTYAAAASDLGLTLNALRKAVFDLRKNYVLEFRAAVAPTVRGLRSEINEESSVLLDLLPEAIALENNAER